MMWGTVRRHPDVARPRDELDGDPPVYGCGGARYLVERGVVDEVRLWVHPVVWGSGVRVFHGGDPARMRVIGVTPFESGITLCGMPRKKRPSDLTIEHVFV